MRGDSSDNAIAGLRQLTLLAPHPPRGATGQWWDLAGRRQRRSTPDALRRRPAAEREQRCPETSQVIQRTTPDRPAHQRPNGAPPSGPAKLEPDEPAQRSRPVGIQQVANTRQLLVNEDQSAHIPASRIKVLGCEIQDPHLLQPNQIARIVLLSWSLRLPPLLLVLVAVYRHDPEDG